MQVLAGVAGVCLVALVLVDAFNTIVLARRTRHVFRITRAYYKLTWRPFAAVGRHVKSPHRREGFLGIYGPLSLLLLFALWAVSLILAFALLQRSVGMRPASLAPTFSNYLYLSATTLFTLTNGDPVNTGSKIISALEAGLGLSFLGLVVGYLPVLYQSFAKRELAISLLDARAGSPPSAGALLTSAPSTAEKLEGQLAAWESWAAQLLENQLSFPMLAYFRSHHSNQAWLTALVAITDFAAVVSVAAKGDLQQQAELTFAMCRHVLADITVVFDLGKDSEKASGEERFLDSAQQTMLHIAAGVPLLDTRRLSLSHLAEHRRQYEPHAIALGNYFLMSLPDWIGDEASRSNWKVALSDPDDAPFAVSDPFAHGEGS